MLIIKLLIILSLFCSVYAKKMEKVNLQLEWKYQFEFAGYIAAKEKGFYEEFGLDVSINEFTNIDTIETVLNNDASYGVHNSGIILSKMQKKPVVLLSSFFKKSALVFVAKKDIKSPSDLTGKTIMAGHGQLNSSNLGVLINKFNIKIGSINVVPHTFNVEPFINKEVDVMTAYVSNELYELKQRDIKYNILDPVNYGIFMYGGNLFTSKSEVDKHPKRVNDFKLATIKGWEYALKNKRELVDIIYNKYSKSKSKDALLFESKEIEKLIMPNVFDIGYIDHLVVKNIANSFVQLGLNSKYYDLDNFIYGKNEIESEEKSIKLNLSENEKEYLKNKTQFTMCIDPDWLPYEAFSNDKHIGMSADYFKIIEELIGIPINVIKTKSWSQSLEFGKQRVCDIFSLVVDTPSRRTYLNFTKPYFSFPLVVATKHNKSFVADISNIKDKKLSIVKGYAFIEILMNRFPNIDLIEVSNVENGLKLVESEVVFGHIDTLPVLGYQIQQGYLDTLKIAGKFDEKWELGIGVRNDDDLMFSILNKAASIVPAESIQGILNKWISVTVEQKVDLIFLWKYIVVFLSILLFILYKYYLSNKHKNQLLKLTTKLNVSNEKYSALVEMFDLNVIAYKIDTKGVILYTSKALEIATGYEKEELLGEDCLILYSNLNEEHSHLQFKHKFKELKTYTYETQNKKKDGSYFWVQETINVHLNSKKKISGYDIILEDISAKKEVENFNQTLELNVSNAVNENRKKDQVISQQNKLVAMGEMVGAIAHQWRQPLTALSGRIQLLKLDYIDNMITEQYVDEYIEESMSIVLFMSNTIDDFRDFFRIDKERKIFEITHSISSTMNLMNAQLKHHNIAFELNESKEYKILGFEAEFQQVILNIINNSKDEFIEKNIKDAKISIDIKEDQDFIIINIGDNAGGINKDALDKVFEPYFTTKEQGKGTGMGLYMSKMIICDNMSGNLSVKNISNGALFSIKLNKISTSNMENK